MKNFMKVVIFDLDGTLIDSEPFHRKATTRALELYGISRNKAEEISFRGRPLVEAMSWVVSHYKVDASVEEFVKIRNEIFFRFLMENDIEMQGAIKLINLLKERGFKIAIGTSAGRDLTDFALKKLNIANKFDAVSTVEDVEKGKPEPDIFLKAAEMLNVNPSECIVIEDSANGIKAAKKAGMKVIGFRSKHSTGEDLSIADYVIDSFDEFNFNWLGDKNEE